MFSSHRISLSSSCFVHAITVFWSQRQPESSEGKHVSPQLPRQSSSQQHTLPGSTLPHVDCVGGHAAGHCPLPGAPASDTPTPVSICSGAAGGARGKGGKTEEASHRQRGGEPVRTERVTKLLLILKWGGELTKLGERQARELGNSFRSILYPDMGCGGLLRLHRRVSDTAIFGGEN